MLSVLTALYLLFANPILCLYSSSDNVIELTENNFDRVTSSDSLWLVEFYAPWCGHCQNLAPEWKKVAKVLKGIVNVGAVNADEFKSLGHKYNVRGFPTIMIFGDDKYNPSTYSGGRNANQIVAEAIRLLTSVINSRLGGGSTDGTDGSDVIELTESNFDKTVLSSEESWLVEFFAPWCGHCKNLKPHWEKAAQQLKGLVKVAAVDATVHTQLASRYGVQGFPTIKFFPSGPKSGSPVEYDGGRTAEDIIQWAIEKSEATLPVPEIKELTSPEVFKEACEDHTICIISILPDLLDCQATCRNEYLEIVKKEAENYKKQKWGWIWTEALKQPDLEQALDVGGFGYPAMVTVHGRKMKRTTMRGSFSPSSVHEFLLSVSVGGGSLPLYDLKTMPQVQTVEPWDGMDAKPVEEEEIDLSELGLHSEL